MTQVPILAGIYTDSNADYRTAYPRNLIPVPKPQGIADGYLRPADGIVPGFFPGPGVTRGGILWKDFCYRVMGTKLVKVLPTGEVVIIGDVGGTGPVTMDYSFTHLGIASSGLFYLYDGTTLAQVTDPDLGTVIDFLWLDGYFVVTDGETVAVTELNDPFAVNPFKYGSSEVDPDPVVALFKVRNELIVINRHTIETFQNVGGDFFPFQRVPGAQGTRGGIGTFAVSKLIENFAFLGSGKNESPAIWFLVGGQLSKVSSREIDQILQEFDEATLSQVVMETRVDKNHSHLLVHLPNQTLVYDFTATQSTETSPVWFTLSSGIEGNHQYTARYLVWAYNKWLVGHVVDNRIGYLTTELSTHWGETIQWMFHTPIIYAESKGVIVNELELVALTGRVTFGVRPTIWTQYSLDGEKWSMPRPISAGKAGETTKRLVWLQQGMFRNWRTQRVFGLSDTLLSPTRFEADLEPLAF